jgi:hypothetical protein
VRTYYDRGGDKAVVEVARDGLQAVEAFKNSREGELEAILMDIMMPNMDGIQRKLMRYFPISLNM